MTEPASPLPPTAAPTAPRRRRRPVAALVVVLVAGLVALTAVLADGRTRSTASAITRPAQGGFAQAGRTGPAAASPDTAAADVPGGDDAGGDQVDPLAPLPKGRPKVVAPVAGRTTSADAERRRAAAIDADARKDLTLPKPKGPATVTGAAGGRAPSVRGLKVDQATALPNGVALPPLEAPEAVLDVIRAGNTIARSPYKWGGGHGSFQDSGYDCSGSVSFALYAAGLIEGSRTSGALMSWGRPGKGRWITVYANGGHTFMEVAGIRFDTSGQRVTGSRWQNEFRPTAGFVARHPAGL